MKWKFLFIVFLLPILVNGQTNRVSADFFYSPPVHLTDSSKKYQYVEYRVGLTIPVYYKHYMRETDKGASSSIVLLNIGILSGHPSNDWIQGNEQYVDVFAGLTGIFNLSKKYTLFAIFNNSFEDKLITNGKIGYHISGLFLFKHNLMDDFHYQAGAAYSNVFGDGIVFPLLGLGGNFGSKVSIDALLPMNVNLKIRPVDNQTYSLFIKSHGGMNYFINDEKLFNSDDILRFQRREFKVGMSAKYDVKKLFSFYIEGGSLQHREIMFSRTNDKMGSYIYDAKVDKSFYFEIGFSTRIEFSSKDLDDTFDWTNQL